MCVVMTPIRNSSDVNEHHRQPCTQEDISCLLAISGRSEIRILYSARELAQALSLRNPTHTTS